MTSFWRDNDVIITLPDNIAEAGRLWLPDGTLVTAEYSRRPIGGGPTPAVPD